MAVELNHRIEGQGEPVLILHGLFGSSRNWTGIARRLADSHMTVNVDLRNHGSSAHDDLMTYHDMAGDLERLLGTLGCGRASLVGHSMGGKVAMVFTLLSPHLVDRLVVLDIAPVNYFHEYSPLMEALMNLPLAALADRKQADSLLAPAVSDRSIRNFLLQNLVRDTSGWKWRINLQSIRSNLEVITGFPEVETGGHAGPALFLGGTCSDYMGPDTHVRIRTLFRQAEIDYIDGAGHLLHVDQPESVLDRIRAFLAKPGT